MQVLNKLITLLMLLCFSSSALAANVIVDEKPAEKQNALRFYGENSTILTEEELKAEVDKIKQFYVSKKKDATIYIRYEIAEVSNTDTDIYVSLGNCYVDKDQKAIVSSTKCSESITYKYVGITEDPKGFGAYNASYRYYRVIVPSEPKILVETQSKDMTREFTAAVVKDRILFDSVKTKPYPGVFCSSLKKLGYNPLFTDEEKSLIKQCLHLN